MDQAFIDSEPEQFNCDTCPRRLAAEGLDDENRAAWALWKALNNRFLGETQCVGPVFMRLTADQRPDELLDTCERLRVLFDTFSPRKE